MKMKRIWSTGGRDNRIWHDEIVDNLENLSMSECNDGDLVYISGNLVNGKPTAVYGPHKVKDRLSHILENRRGRLFPEHMDVFRKVQYIGNLNRQGNWMVESFWCMRETTYYWRKLSSDWWPYKTWQDANYFGIWINYDTRQVLTFAEGDESLVECVSQRRFLNELHSMDRFYQEG